MHHHETLKSNFSLCKIYVVNLYKKQCFLVYYYKFIAVIVVAVDDLISFNTPRVKSLAVFLQAFAFSLRYHPLTI